MQSYRQAFARPLRFCFILSFLFVSLRALPNTYYVSPSGSDQADGTLRHPFLSVQRAQQAVSPGDTVYIRGGDYRMNGDQIAREQGMWAYVTYLDKSGLPGKEIHYWAYPGEKPVFHYDAIRPPGRRVIAFCVSASYLHIKGLEVTGVQVTLSGHTQSECFENRGSHNIYERLRMRDGMAIGFYLTGGADNLILNCDAYRNWDSVSEGGKGGNTDGFGCHPRTAADTNNIFRGCRAWLNSDDGFDCINAHAATVFDHCWSFYNGYSSGFISRADGNGFKAGGYGATPADRLPGSIPRNTVEFCLAVGNKANGFYANHHLNGDNWYQNSAYRNGVNFNMVNRRPPRPSDPISTHKGYDYAWDVPGYGHLMRNNLGFGARGHRDTLNIDTLASDVRHNAFSMGLSVDTTDFVSMDESELILPRGKDGNLPDIHFLHLARGSKLIDKGVPIGFPFSGKAPDLGCFESSYGKRSGN